MFASIKTSCLSWFGIGGGVMTICSSLESVIEFTKWAPILTTSWADWINILWNWVLSLIPFNINAGGRYQMTMAIFVICVAVGSRVLAKSGNHKREDWPSGWRRAFHQRVGIAVLLFLASIAAANVITLFPNFQTIPMWGLAALVAIFAGLYLAAIVVGLWDWPIANAVFVAISMLAMSAVFQQVGDSDLNTEPASQLASDILGNGAAILCGLVVLCYARPKAFSMRLSFIFVGLVMLIGLNELAGLSLDMKASRT